MEHLAGLILVSARDASRASFGRENSKIFNFSMKCTKMRQKCHFFQNFPHFGRGNYSLPPLDLPLVTAEDWTTFYGLVGSVANLFSLFNIRSSQINGVGTELQISYFQIRLSMLPLRWRLSTRRMGLILISRISLEAYNENEGYIAFTFGSIVCNHSLVHVIDSV